MIFQWDEYLALAKDLSQKGGEAAARSAISRAYYAAYHAAKRHRACRSVLATRGGSHGDVWRTLKDNGNQAWSTAGNQGRRILENRRKADYDDKVPELTTLMYRTVRTAEEILSALRS